MITDSGFCVLKCLLKTRKRVVYGSELIKKRRYWPRGVYRDAINDYFKSKILVMWDVLVVNGKRLSLLFLL